MTPQATVKTDSPEAASVSTGHSSQQTHSQSNASKQACRWSRTAISRMIFLSSMAAAAAICGYIAYRSIDNLEDKVSEETYESVALSALEGAQAITARKVQSSDAMAAVLSASFPNASTWPWVAMPEYINVASKVASLSATTSIGLILVVQPQDAERFEEYAAQVYQDLGYPETAGESAFGFGIFGFDRSNASLSDGRYHDTTGLTPTWNSTRHIMTPIFQHNIVNAKSLMYNVHSNEVRGKAIESSMDCAAAAEQRSESFPACGVVTDVVRLVVRPGPAGLLYQPIFPTYNPNTIVGFLGTSIHWEEVLTNVVPDYVDGLDCVIQTSTETHTYVIQNGKPALVGSGDWHDPTYDQWARSIVLNDIATGASASATYTLTVYPTEVMFQQFHTNSPIAVSVGFVAVILFCTGCFFLYDFFIQSESRQRQVVLDMKRRFVRFISHEIRTPLNTVCMGLDLLRSELQQEMETEKQENQKQDTKDLPKDQQHDQIVTQRQQQQKQHQLLAAYWMELTGDILENTENAVSVLNDLLNYDKIESGNFVLTVGEVNIWSLVEKAVAEFQLPAKNKQVNLQCQISSFSEKQNLQQQQLRVFGDDIRLLQVLRNLVSNALKFTPTNGTVKVAASFLPQGPPKEGQDKNDMDLEGGSSSARGGSSSSWNCCANKHRGHHKNPIDEAPCPHPRAGVISIEVTDTGAGMTPEQLSQLFREYIQFDSNKLQSGGGSGLGLNITKEIVEQHGGTVVATSQGHNKGSTFTVQLPLYQYPLKNKKNKDTRTKTRGHEDHPEMESNAHVDPEKYDDEEETSDHTSLETPQQPQNHHILVVDDVVTNSKMMVRLLERAGHTCVVANNGKEAIEAYLENQRAVQNDESVHAVDPKTDDGDNAGALVIQPFDTILMDSEMPVMDGPEATKRLRAMGCHAYIFGVTGNVLAEDVAHFRECGADDVVPKPVKLSMLDDCWSRAL